MWGYLEEEIATDETNGVENFGIFAGRLSVISLYS